MSSFPSSSPKVHNKSYPVNTQKPTNQDYSLSDNNQDPDLKQAARSKTPDPPRHRRPPIRKPSTKNNINSHNDSKPHGGITNISESHHSQLNEHETLENSRSPVKNSKSLSLDPNTHSRNASVSTHSRKPVCRDPSSSKTGYPDSETTPLMIADEMPSPVDSRSTQPDSRSSTNHADGSQLEGTAELSRCSQPCHEMLKQSSLPVPLDLSAPNPYLANKDNDVQARADVDEPLPETTGTECDKTGKSRDEGFPEITGLERDKTNPSCGEEFPAITGYEYDKTEKSSDEAPVTTQSDLNRKNSTNAQEAIFVVPDSSPDSHNPETSLNPSSEPPKIPQLKIDTSPSFSAFVPTQDVSKLSPDFLATNNSSQSSAQTDRPLSTISVTSKESLHTVKRKPVRQSNNIQEKKEASQIHHLLKPRAYSTSSVTSNPILEPLSVPENTATFDQQKTAEADDFFSFQQQSDNSKRKQATPHAYEPACLGGVGFSADSQTLGKYEAGLQAGSVGSMQPSNHNQKQSLPNGMTTSLAQCGDNYQGADKDTDFISADGAEKEKEELDPRPRLGRDLDLIESASGLKGFDTQESASDLKGLDKHDSILSSQGSDKQGYPQELRLKSSNLQGPDKLGNLQESTDPKSNLAKADSTFESHQAPHPLSEKPHVDSCFLDKPVLDQTGKFNISELADSKTQKESHTFQDDSFADTHGTVAAQVDDTLSEEDETEQPFVSTYSEEDNQFKREAKAVLLSGKKKANEYKNTLMKKVLSKLNKSDENLTEPVTKEMISAPIECRDAQPGLPDHLGPGLTGIPVATTEPGVLRDDQDLKLQAKEPVL